MKDESESLKESFKRAGDLPRESFAREVFEFLKTTKKWWLIPIIVVFVIFGALIYAGGGAAPFIYSFF